MKLRSGISAVILSFALAIAPEFTACSPDDNNTDIEEPETPDKPDTPDTPDVPDKPATYYSLVTEPQASWDGDWIIAYVDGNDINAFHSMDSENGMGRASKIEDYTPADKIPAATGDSYKTVIKKNGGSYTIKVTNVGYIGSSGSKKMVSSSVESSDKSYLWSITFDNGYVVLKPENQSNSLQYNVSAGCFRFYGANSQKQLKIFKRDVSDGETGGGDKPDPDPDPEPTPEPDPSDPVATTGYKWFELPAINAKVDRTKYLIDQTNSDLYYAYHLCDGNEKYAHNGKKARNYTVCFSANHHCPVWVAAIRHNGLHPIGVVERTNAYGKDPDIPSDIQYNSKATGGGCNKGHMLGSKERTSSTATNRQVFYYSNIAPQDSDGFNTGGAPWNTLEDYVDGLVPQDSLYIVIGCYFDKYTDVYGKTNNPGKISFGGRSDVSMPTMFYYALLRTKKGNTGKSVTQCSADELMCVAYVLRHETEAKKKGENYKLTSKDLISISDLEKITGFKYFVNVPNAPKSTFNAADWL